MTDPVSGEERGRRRRLSGYALELIVVFIGVWLSLLAENWRQAREDGVAERASMSRMAEDLETDIADLELNEERARVGVEYGRAILAGGIPSDSLPRALSALQFCGMFIENPAEYQALRNSGNLGIISDEVLRSRIVAHYEARIFLRRLHEDDCEWTKATLQLLLPWVDLVEPAETATIYDVGPDGFRDMSRPRVAEVRNPVSLLGDVEFRNTLTTMVTRRRFLVGRIVDMNAEAEALRAELVGRGASD